MTDCANHVCGNQCHAEGGVTCPLCHGATYCSEECRQVDAIKHDCPNVVRIAAPNDTLFVPYMYEDRMTAAELGDADPRSPLVANRLLVHHAADRNMSTRVLPALIEADSGTGWVKNFVTPTIGINPMSDERTKAALAGALYTITIEHLD